jgi:hypothetical protein
MAIIWCLVSVPVLGGVEMIGISRHNVACDWEEEFVDHVERLRG